MSWWRLQFVSLHFHLRDKAISMLIWFDSSDQIAAAVEGFFWPKIFWDFATTNLDPVVKPVPVLQLLNLFFGKSSPLPMNGRSASSKAKLSTVRLRPDWSCTRSLRLRPLSCINRRIPAFTILWAWLRTSGLTARERLVPFFASVVLHSRHTRDW